MEYVKEPYPFTEEEPEKNHGLTKNGNIICAGLQDGRSDVVLEQTWACHNCPEIKQGDGVSSR